MIKGIRHIVVDISWACILAGLAAALYSNASSISLLVALIVMATLTLFSEKRVRVQPVDWSVLLLGAFEIPSLLFSQYRANSIRGSLAIALFVLIYCAARLTVRATADVVVLCSLLGLGGGWLAVSGFSEFSNEARLLTTTGLTNLVAFRSRLISSPTPWVVGEWFTLLLLALPFASAFCGYLWQKQLKWYALAAVIFPFLVTVTLTLSLSRAIFWSITGFCLLVCAFMVAGRIITLRKGAVLFASALCALVLILACESALFPGVFRAYVGQHSSQVRSTEGRLAIWHRSLEIVRAHPLLGVGSSNSALVLTSSADQEETTGFASRTFSLPLQVLTEKGIIGFGLYTIFLVLVGREFTLGMRYSRSGVARVGSVETALVAGQSTSRTSQADESARAAMTCCFAAGLVAVLVRELVYSSLFEHSLTLALIGLLCALLVHPDRG